MLCPYLPVPPAHGGAVRMLNLIKNLSLHDDVDVLSFIDHEEELASDAPDLAPFCRRLTPRRCGIPHMGATGHSPTVLAHRGVR